MEITGVLIGILGVALTVIFGVIGMRAISKNKHSQKQTTKHGSTSVQSGRDTNIDQR